MLQQTPAEFLVIQDLQDHRLHFKGSRWQASQIQNTAGAHQIALGVNVGCLPSKTHTCLPFRELARQARSIRVR